MAIIDAQVHLWRKGTPSPPHLAKPYLVEDAIRGMDEAGVDGAILHPPTSWDPDSNEQAVEAVLAYPKRFAILGYPPLDKPDSRSLVATWKQRPGMLGLRLYFNKPHNRSWPTDGTLDWLWPAAEQAQLPLALLAGDWLPLLGQIAARHPSLKLAVWSRATFSGVTMAARITVTGTEAIMNQIIAWMASASLAWNWVVMTTGISSTAMAPMTPSPVIAPKIRDRCW